MSLLAKLALRRVGAVGEARGEVASWEKVVKDSTRFLDHAAQHEMGTGVMAVDEATRELNAAKTALADTIKAKRDAGHSFFSPFR